MFGRESKSKHGPNETNTIDKERGQGRETYVLFNQLSAGQYDQTGTEQVTFALRQLKAVKISCRWKPQPRPSDSYLLIRRRLRVIYFSAPPFFGLCFILLSALRRILRLILFVSGAVENATFWPVYSKHNRTNPSPKRWRHEIRVKF